MEYICDDLLVVNIYKARNLILGFDEPPLNADIPVSYHLPNTVTPSHSALFPSSDLIPTPTNANPSPISPLLSPLISPTWQYPTPTTAPPNAPPFEEDAWKAATSKQNDMYNFPSASSTTVLNTSNILDHAPTHILNRVTSSNWSDLPGMLSSLGLERYISVFTTHEIDLTTFSTLTDQDLIEIGINAFGARRKILLAISGKRKTIQLTL
ncbi:hypothetical protein NQ315_000349 [Exocentrus adspersus]|uniref:SAM domain-containing protein n=1 Tax=Exocentrus adspersus TaxID=1586481 RepID=A0AAV8VM99_9CUCU|nr:hypothetical protein NQ315_000349 [Exocentrus adspersus]